MHFGLCRAVVVPGPGAGRSNVPVTAIDGRQEWSRWRLPRPVHHWRWQRPLAEIVEPGVTGMTFPSKDSDALADAVAVLLTDRPHARHLARTAQAMVRTPLPVGRDRRVYRRHLPQHHRGYVWPLDSSILE
jgi:hypothetical protein